MAATVKPRRSQPILLALVGLALVAVVGLSVFTLPVNWSLVEVALLFGVAAWLVLLRTGRDFVGILLAALIVGYFQGLLTKLLGNRLPDWVWGLLKYGLLGLMAIGLLLRAAQGQRVRLNRTLMAWLVCWGLTWLLLVYLMLEAKRANPAYSPVGTIQIFAVANMALLPLTYLQLRRSDLDAGLALLIGAGVLAAVFGIAQRLVGPNWLAAHGLISLDPAQIIASQTFLPGGNDPQLAFLDVKNGFRAFSFFDSQHGFSAFLILPVLALQIQRLRGRVRATTYWLCLALMAGGFLVTFNFTNALTCGFALLVLALLQRRDNQRSLVRVLLSRRLWQRGLVVLILGLLLTITVPSLRARLLTLLVVSTNGQGAGASLAYRLQGVQNGLQALTDYPLGLGLYLNSSAGAAFIPALNFYARIPDYFGQRTLFFSGDNWFEWLTVQIGLPGFALYAALFLIPIVYGWWWHRSVRDRDLRILARGCLALLIAVFVAGLSNSALLAFPPSNWLVWIAGGILLKAPVWDRESQRTDADRH